MAELTADFSRDIFPSIRAYCQQGMSDLAAINECNLAGIYAGLWDADKQCVAEKAFTLKIARRMGLDGRDTVWDRAAAVKAWIKAIQDYRDNKRAQQAASYGTHGTAGYTFEANNLPRDGRRIVASR